jgi:hypothetical protein
MPEANTLDRVAERVPVPDDALERLQKLGAVRTRRSRVSAAALALVIALTAGAGLWTAFGQKKAAAPRHLGPVGPAAGTFVRFPALGEVRHAPNDALIVNVRTNLPDGTRVIVSMAQQGGTQLIGVALVDQGVISIQVHNYNCDFIGVVRSSPIHVSLVVVPTTPRPIPCASLGREVCRVRQPDSVYRALGRRFQRLHGPQVTRIDGVNRIIVAQSYVFPASMCQSSTSGSQSGPVSSIQPPSSLSPLVVPLFPGPEDPSTCCTDAETTAIAYAKTLGYTGLDSGGCFTRARSSRRDCPNGVATQAFHVHQGCPTCPWLTVRVDQVRARSGSRWGVTEALSGRVSASLTAGQEVTAGSIVTIPTSLPNGTRMEANWVYLSPCVKSIGPARIVRVEGGRIRFPVATFGVTTTCPKPPQRTTGSLRTPIGGVIWVQRAAPGGGGPVTDLFAVSVLFVPVS